MFVYRSTQPLTPLCWWFSPLLCNQSPSKWFAVGWVSTFNVSRPWIQGNCKSSPVVSLDPRNSFIYSIYQLCPTWNWLQLDYERSSKRVNETNVSQTGHSVGGSSEIIRSWHNHMNHPISDAVFWSHLNLVALLQAHLDEDSRMQLCENIAGDPFASVIYNRYFWRQISYCCWSIPRRNLVDPFSHPLPLKSFLAVQNPKIFTSSGWSQE